MTRYNFYLLKPQNEAVGGRFFTLSEVKNCEREERKEKRCKNC